MSIPWRWVLAGAVLGAGAVGGWWWVERARWVAASADALARAATAAARHQADSVRIAAGQRRADSLQQAARDQVARAREADRRAVRAAATADQLTADLAAATSIGDSVELLVARDTARLATIAALEAEVDHWRRGYDLSEQRGDTLALLLVAAQDDAGRLAGVVRDLERRVQAGVPGPRRLLGILPLPRCGPGVVVALGQRPSAGLACIVTL